MPATRLLVLADPKMLPALANGLREGAKFDVLTLPFGDAGAAAAAQRADALAVFYGSPTQSLQSVVQELAPAVRSRGGRVVAVLQREQAAQRDDCFRAGASDLLFMPLPKEQFVSRLAASVGLSYTADPGVPAAVQIGARGNLVPLAQATVTLAGIHASAALPFQPGETVRVSWATFECWGLVARASPEAQVRFAGLAQDEEARIREWAHKMGAPVSAPSRPDSAAAPVTGPIKPSAPVTGPIKPSAPVTGPIKPSAPVTGPIKPSAPRPVSPPNVSPPVSGRMDRPQVKAATPPPQAVPAPAASNARVVSPPAAGAPAAAVPPRDGPAWPTVPDAAACKSVGMAMLREKKAPAGATPELAAAAKKVIGVMNVGERNALEKAGPDSHFAATLAARIALELARAEATRLLNIQPAPVVDDDSVKAVTDIVDTAVARLQKEVEVAIGRADVDTLQLLTVANAALSRDLLVFREAGDRIRGVGTSPRPGAGALDPDIVLPGQIPRPASKTADRPVMKPELREFDGLGERPARSRKALLFLSVLAGAAAAAYLVLFAYPRISEVRAPILGIARIEVSGKVARVTLSTDFAEHEARAIAMLTQTLRERGVDRALLVQRNGSVAGQLSVQEGKVHGLASSTKPGDAAPGVTPQSVPSAIPAQAASAQPQ